MVKWMMGAALLLASPGQNAPADPDLLYKKDLGVSIRKPAKNEEWEFKEKGFFANSQLVVAHKVDTVMIDIFAQDKATGFSYYDPKTAAEGEYKNISGFPDVKDAKKIEIKAAKLPAGGAGNVMAQFLDMTFKRGDKSWELKMWCFVGRENQNFYKVTLVGEEGTYKKHQRILDPILGSVRIWKLPK
jgi:hypothetical protein